MWGIYRALNLKIYTFYVGTFDLISILLNNIRCNEKMSVPLYILSACKHIKLKYYFNTRGTIITSIQHGKSFAMTAHNTHVLKFEDVAPDACRTHHFLPLFLLFWAGFVIV